MNTPIDLHDSQINDCIRSLHCQHRTWNISKSPSRTRDGATSIRRAHPVCTRGYVPGAPPSRLARSVRRRRLRSSTDHAPAINCTLGHSVDDRLRTPRYRRFALQKLLPKRAAGSRPSAYNDIVLCRARWRRFRILPLVAFGVGP